MVDGGAAPTAHEYPSTLHPPLSTAVARVPELCEIAFIHLRTERRTSGTTPRSRFEAHAALLFLVHVFATRTSAAVDQRLDAHRVQ
jgi:hypothetical protein